MNQSSDPRCPEPAPALQGDCFESDGGWFVAFAYPLVVFWGLVILIAVL